MPTRLSLDRRWVHLPVYLLVLALALLCVSGFKICALAGFSIKGDQLAGVGENSPLKIRGHPSVLVSPR